MIIRFRCVKAYLHQTRTCIRPELSKQSAIEMYGNSSTQFGVICV